MVDTFCGIALGHIGDITESPDTTASEKKLLSGQKVIQFAPFYTKNISIRASVETIGEYRSIENRLLTKGSLFFQHDSYNNMRMTNCVASFSRYPTFIDYTAKFVEDNI